jgi:hypothetical protein
MEGNLLGSLILLVGLGTFFIASGWYYYCGRSAARLLRDQVLFRMFPGAACGLPLEGLACYGLALGLVVPQPLKQPILLISVAAGLIAIGFFGWCPRGLLPSWLRKSQES